MASIDQEVAKNALLSSYKRRYEYAKIRNRYDYRFGTGVVGITAKELCLDLESDYTYSAPFMQTQLLSIGQVTPDEMNVRCKDSRNVHELLDIMLSACFIGQEQFRDAYAQGNLQILGSSKSNDETCLFLARPMLEITGIYNGVECTSYLYLSSAAGMADVVAYDTLQGVQ